MTNNVSGIGGIGYPTQTPQSDIMKWAKENMTEDAWKEVEGKSPAEVMDYLKKTPSALKSAQSGQTSQTGQTGQTGQTSETGDLNGPQDLEQKTGAAAATDEYQQSEDCGDCYDENSKIPSDETMAQPQMCGMGGTSKADKCKPYAQKCLGDTKAIKKVLETIQKADQDNPTIGADIKEVDGISKEIQNKLKKGKKAADGEYSNPEDEGACKKEIDDLVKKAMEIAENNGVTIELSEKRANDLGVGGGSGQQGAATPAAATPAAATPAAATPAAATPAAATPAAGKADAAKPQAADTAKTDASKQTDQTKKTDEAKKTDDAKKTDETKQEDKKTDEAGGEQEQQKPFKIISEPREVDKDLSLDDVKNNPALASALESSLDEQIAAQENQNKGAEGTKPPEAIDLGATKEGSPLAQGIDNAGSKPSGDGKTEDTGASVFGAQTAATQQTATTTQATSTAQNTGGKTGAVGAAAGAAQDVGGAGVGKAVDTKGIESKLKKLGMDSNKKFKVKAQVYEPGMDVKIQRDGEQSPVKVSKNLGDASMKVTPPPLAAIDKDGQMHRIGDIKATDAGKSGVFAAKIKEGQPIMNLAAATNAVKGDIAIPGTKTEQAKAA